MEKWQEVLPKVKQAHTEAILRLRMPGPAQLTPNQLKQDEQVFNDAIGRAGIQPSLDDLSANRLDLDRFQPLLNYLTNIQKRLVDLSENPTQP
jgi:hypothetical protein